MDCFANFYHKKVNKFYSRFWNPGCSGVDFFVQNLTVPPVNLIQFTICIHPRPWLLQLYPSGFRRIFGPLLAEFFSVLAWTINCLAEGLF